MWKFQNKFRWIYGCLAVVLGLCSAHKIFEDDFYWQLRAGNEFLASLRWTATDQWSYTVQGTPWSNYEWLSCVIFRVFFALGEEAACVLLRVGLVVGLFLILGSLVEKILAERPLSFKLLSVGWLFPAIFTILQFRLQLRPELFGFLIFAGMLRLWISEKSFEYRMRWTLLGILLWANLHGGTAVFGVFSACIWILFQKVPFSTRFLGSGAAVLAFFVTPLHVNIIRVLLAHYQYNQSITNLEWQGFSWSFLNLSINGWSILLWLIFTGMGFIAFLSSRYMHRLGMGLILAVYTYLSFTRIRVIPYQTLFLIPVLLSSWNSPWIQTGLLRRRGYSRVLNCLVIFLWFWVIPSQAWRLQERYGLSADGEQFPVSTYRFLKSIHPDKNIFSGFLAGGYQLWSMPDYPVFVDPRDILYNPIKSKMMEALGNPSVFRELIEHYQINSVLFFSNPLQRSLGNAPSLDPVEQFLNRSEWALVYFDNKQMTFIRRTVANAEKIYQYEYRFLRPSLPAPSYFLGSLQSVEDRKQFVEELNRCISNEPRNVYCRSVQAGLLGVQNTPENREQASAILQETTRYALKIHPQLLMYLKPMYLFLGLGNTQAISDIDSKMQNFIQAGPGIWNI